MNLLEQAEKAFYAEEYFERMLVAESENQPEFSAYWTIWTILVNAANLSAALLALRPMVHNAHSPYGVAFRNLWHALQDCAA